MYIPEAYQMNDREAALDFIEKNSFGILVSHSDKLEGTHLPFIIKRDGEGTYLYGHMARANPQWKGISGEVLVVFSGPHVYVSPSWYETTNRRVPTWNYVTVHVYGQFELVTNLEEVVSILGETIDFFESAYEKPWGLGEADTDYLEQLYPHIVGFKIKITRIEAAHKLHQDHSIETQEGVIHNLEQGGNDHSRKIAEMMKNNLKARPN